MNPYLNEYFDTQLVDTRNFINREVELTKLQYFIEQKEINQLSIIGIPGIGKTYLAAHFAKKIKDQKNFRVLWLTILKEPTFSNLIEILFEKIYDRYSFISRQGIDNNFIEKDKEIINNMHNCYDILFIDNYNFVNEAKINNLICALHIKTVLISSCLLEFLSLSEIRIKPWEEEVTLTLLKPLIWCGYIEGINGIKEIHNKSGGHPGIIDAFIKDLSDQSNNVSIYKSLNTILEDRFIAFTDKDLEVLYFCLHIDKDNHRLLFINDIEYKRIKEKLQKYLLLQITEHGVYYMPYEPALYGMIPEHFKNRNIKELDYFEPGSFFEMIGKLYIKTGNWKKAEDILLKYLGKSENSNDKHSICIAYSQLAVVYQYKSDFIKEIACCHKILENKNECEPEILIDTFILLGDNYRLRGEYTNAFERFSQAEDIFALYPDDRFNLQKARILLSKGYIFNIMGDDNGTDCLNRSAGLFGEINDIQGQGAVLVYKGIYELENDNLDSAEQLFNKALSISYEGNNRMIEYFVLNLLSQLQLIQGKTEEAYHLCIQSIISKIDLGAKHGIADSLMTFVPILRLLPGDFDKTQLFSLLNDIKLYYSNLLTDNQMKQLQQLEIRDADIDLPLLLLNCAIDIFEHLDAKYYLTKVYIEKANIHIVRGEIAPARSILSEIQHKYAIPYHYQKLNIRIKTMVDNIS